MATGSIRERNGRFYVRTRVLVIDSQTGQARWKQVEKAAGPSRRRAQKILRGLQGDVDDGRYVPSSISVLELGRKWLAEHVEPNLKPGAAANYRGTFYRHVAPGLGSVRVDDCAPQMVRALLGQKRAEGLSEETVAKIRRHVHAMFAFAQDAGLVTVNPADAPRMRGRKHSRRRARGTELSPVQVKRFLEACSPRWRLFFTVALDTGLRRGELIGLRWGDIDLLERILYVRRSIGSYDEPNATRSRSFDEDELALAQEFDLPAGEATPLEEDGPAGRLSTKTEASERLVPILDGAQTALEKLYLSAKTPPITRRCSPRSSASQAATGSCAPSADPSAQGWSPAYFAATPTAPGYPNRSAYTTCATPRSPTRSAKARTSCWSPRSPDTPRPPQPSTSTATSCPTASAKPPGACAQSATPHPPTPHPQPTPNHPHHQHQHQPTTNQKHHPKLDRRKTRAPRHSSRRNRRVEKPCGCGASRASHGQTWRSASEQRAMGTSS